MIEPRRPFQPRGPRQGPRKELHRINGLIHAPMVRMVGNEDESKNGVMPFGQALRLAEEAQLDLVEIVPNQDPPICRIIEYSKFKYEEKKRLRENKSRQHVQQMKEIRFGPQTDEHDFNFKVRHAQRFLQEGHKVKAVVFFRGRSIVYKDQGETILLQFAQAMEADGKVESLPRLEGKRMYLILNPKSGPKKATKPAEPQEIKKPKIKPEVNDRDDDGMDESDVNFRG